jgi:hypothetical protein
VARFPRRRSGPILRYSVDGQPTFPLVSLVGGFLAVDRLEGVDPLDRVCRVDPLDRIGGFVPVGLFDRFVLVDRFGVLVTVAQVADVASNTPGSHAERLTGLDITSPSRLAEILSDRRTRTFFQRRATPKS